MLTSFGSEVAELKAQNAIDEIPENKLMILITYTIRSMHLAKNISKTKLKGKCARVLNAMEALLLIC